LSDFDPESQAIIEYAKKLLRSDMLTRHPFPTNSQTESMTRECILTAVAHKNEKFIPDDLQREYTFLLSKSA
jgi:hypothetical protein